MIDLKNGCQEAALGLPFHLPCGRPVEFIVSWKGRSDKPVRMCAACADHNVRNRNGQKRRVAPPAPPDIKAVAAPVPETGVAGQIVDAIGRLKSEISKLTGREADLKLQLREMGVKEADGQVFRATVGDDQEYEVRDEAFRELVERLVLEHTSPQYRAAHTVKKVREGSVRVVARLRKAS